LARNFAGLSEATVKAIVQASTGGVDHSRHHLTRYSMYRALSGVLAQHDSLRRTCLTISGSSRLARVLGLWSAQLVEVDYPEHTLLALAFGDAEFDFCVSDQVLEHVAGDPFEAVKESFRVIRPGGFVAHTSCLINPVHSTPKDYWRFTPDALALLCHSAGGRVVKVGGWGNREALALIQMGFRRLKVPLDDTHPLHRIATLNERAWPIHTWVVAQRPE
jgi:hypothetical protein